MNVFWIPSWLASNPFWSLLPKSLKKFVVLSDGVSLGAAIEICKPKKKSRLIRYFCYFKTIINRIFFQNLQKKLFFFYVRVCQLRVQCSIFIQFPAKQLISDIMNCTSYGQRFHLIYMLSFGSFVMFDLWILIEVATPNRSLSCRISTNLTMIWCFWMVWNLNQLKGDWELRNELLRKGN